MAYPKDPMCKLLNAVGRMLMGISVSQCLVTQKGFVFIDIGIFKGNDIYHWEIETKRESSFIGSKP